MKSKLFLIIAASVVVAVFGILMLRGGQRASRAPAVEKAAPAAAKVRAGRQASQTKIKAGVPRIAVVMDDFGYNMNNLDELFAIGEPVTLSILPLLPYSRRIAQAAAGRGYETILHLPLESHRSDVKEEFDTIRSGMGEKEMTAMLDRQTEDIPGLKGVSNHMGSKSTEEADVMAAIFAYLKKRGLYFLDSLTSPNTICYRAAAKAGLPFARRDVFLDNSNDAEYIRNQLAQARRIALKRGSAIAVCHDRKGTIAVLASAMPEMSREGIRFVFLSELIK